MADGLHFMKTFKQKTQYSVHAICHELHFNLLQLYSQGHPYRGASGSCTLGSTLSKINPPASTKVTRRLIIFPWWSGTGCS